MDIEKSVGVRKEKERERESQREREKKREKERGSERDRERERERERRESKRERERLIHPLSPSYHIIIPVMCPPYNFAPPPTPFPPSHYRYY